MALDTLSECGLGDPAGASDTLVLLSIALESELRADLGATLGQTRHRCRRVLRSQISRQVRLGLEPPTIKDSVLAARELGRVGMGSK